MKYLYDNAASEVVSLFQTILSDTDNVCKWSCLHIEASVSVDERDRNMLYIESSKIIDSYLHGINGTAIFLGTTDIYIFCQNVEDSLLHDAGARLCSHIVGKTGGKAHFSVLETAGLRQQATAAAEGNPYHAANDPQIKRRETMKKVLLVEDDLTTRWLVHAVVKNRCEVLKASTTGQALDIFKRCRPDIVFLDTDLPDRNVQHMMAQMLQQWPEACIIMFSSQSSAESVVSMLADGTAAVISKP